MLQCKRDNVEGIPAILEGVRVLEARILYFCLCNITCNTIFSHFHWSYKDRAIRET